MILGPLEVGLLQAPSVEALVDVAVEHHRRGQGVVVGEGQLVAAIAVVVELRELGTDLHQLADALLRESARGLHEGLGVLHHRRLRRGDGEGERGLVEGLGGREDGQHRALA